LVPFLAALPGVLFPAHAKGRQPGRSVMDRKMHRPAVAAKSSTARRPARARRKPQESPGRATAGLRSSGVSDAAKAIRLAAALAAAELQSNPARDPAAVAEAVIAAEDWGRFGAAPTVSAVLDAMATSGVSAGWAVELDSEVRRAIAREAAEGGTSVHDLVNAVLLAWSRGRFHGGQFTFATSDSGEAPAASAALTGSAGEVVRDIAGRAGLRADDLLESIVAAWLHGEVYVCQAAGGTPGARAAAQGRWSGPCYDGLVDALSLSRRAVERIDHAVARELEHLTPAQLASVAALLSQEGVRDRMDDQADYVMRFTAAAAGELLEGRAEELLRNGAVPL